MSDIDNQIKIFYQRYTELFKKSREEMDRSKPVVDAQGQKPSMPDPDHLELFLLKNETNYIIQRLLPELIIKKFDMQYENQKASFYKHDE